MQENENARNKAARNREGEKPEAVTGTGASAGEPDASHDRLNHIYRVLLGIRNVNQLIVTEDDPRRLIEKACVNLTETMGYHNAWIALLGGEAARELGLAEAGPVAAAAAAGFDGGFGVLRERLEVGEFPDCMNRALAAGDAQVVNNPAADCPECPLHQEYGGCAGLVRRLDFDGVTYGILTASVPAAYARDTEEQDLFNEVANDLAFALHKIATTRRLEESRQHLGLVIEGSGIGTWQWNVQTNETVFNEQWAAMLGYTLEELAPCDYTTWERLVHPEDLPRASQALADCVEGRTVDYNCEFRMKHKDGHWVWILDRGRVMTRDDEGKALAMFGTHTDISGIKQTEEEARNERDLSRSIIEHGPVGITIVTRDGVVKFANRLAEEILGLSKSAIRRRTYNDSDWKITAVDGTQFPDEHLPVRRVLHTGEAVHGVQHAIVWPNGQRRILSVNAAPLKNREGCIDRIVCAIEDITDRNQAEEALQESERRYRHLLDGMLEGCQLITPEWKYAYVNEAAARHGHKTRDELIGRTMMEAYPGIEKGELFAVLRECLDTQSPRRIENEFTYPDGGRGFFQLSIEPVPEGLFILSEDITERKGAEEALRESESRVRTKLNALLDPEGDLETLNLADVVDCNQIQSLMDDFYALTDIGVGIVDLEGKILVAAGYQDICTRFHRVHPETARNCIESDTLLASDTEPGTFKVYKCKNNMWDMVTPIMIGERHLGNLFLGQFLFDDEEPNIEVFREQASRYGFDEEAYLNAYRSIPRWSRQTVHEVMTFYCNLIGVISRLSYAHVKLARTSESLRQSEQRFRSFVENANDIVYALSPEGVFTYVSPNWLDFMGEPAEQAIGKHFEPYVHPEDVHLCRAFLEKTLTTGEKQSSVEYRVRHRDGFWRWHVSNGSPIRDESGTVTGFVGIGRDMTEAKLAEEALAKKQALLTAIYRNAPLVLMVVDEDRRIQQVNGFASQFAGRPVEDMLGLHGGEALRCLHALDDPRGCGFGEYCRQCIIRNTVLDTLETGQTHLQVEAPYYFHNADDEIYEMTFLLSTTPLKTDKQSLALVTMQDITERKQANMALLKTQDELQAIYNSVPLMIGLVDADRRVLYANPTFAGFINSDEASVIQAHACGVFGCVHARQDPRGCGYGDQCHECAILNAINDTLRSGDCRRNVEKEMVVERDEVQSTIWLLASTSRIERAEGHAVLLCMQDITERKQAEEERERLSAQLGQAQKMESVGRLAGGVAHDFNNMLNVILGHAEMMLGDLPGDSDFRADLDEIRKAAERSANLTRQLLAFARKQTIAPKVLDLNETVASMLKMLERLIGEDIDLLWRPAARLAPVRIDPGQVDQMLANLAVNARDAIGHVNGKITIETANACIDEAYCATHAGFLAGDYVMLAVSDDGCGMDEQTRANIFEPFYTSKAVGEGTGLGLATVYGIVKQNDGFVNVYSEPGEGTTFRIYLPAIEADSLDADRTAEGDATAVEGNETILVVEDEAAILNLARKMLEPSGYTVLAASGPGEALRVARDYDGTIDLLITDVVMPEMNGRALSEKLQALCPGLKSLFMSGYTANVIAHHSVLDEGVDFVQKPFSQNDLCKKVREVLDT